MECPSCAQPVPDSARFCPSCGHLLVQTEERRIVTVMFADLVGFTAHAEERDPEQVKHLIDRSFQRLVADITAFGGTVDKIVGDGIVALFGAPRAHEDDPERAVRAALRMQRTVSETTSDWGAVVRMRIGINTGEVLVGALRAGGDYTAMGDTVNLASRLEQAAAPGEVLVGPATMEASVKAIEYVDRGEIIVRGREEGVRVYVARHEIAPPGRRRTAVRAPLVGRNLEHLQLTAAIDTTIERSRAHLLMVLGEAGMGKTRLAEEVAAAVESSHDALVLEGRVLPYGETNPFRPIAEALAEPLGIEPFDSQDVAAAKIRAALGEEEAPAAVDLSVGDFEGDEPMGIGLAAQALLHVLGYDSTLQLLDRERAWEEVRAGIRSYLALLTATRPVLLILGDVNWADDALLELVESCLSGLANERFVVIATARWTVDEERWTVPPGRHNTTILNLDPLDKASSNRLVRSLLGTEVSDEIASVLYDRSGGNPFFLEELTTYLTEAGGVSNAVGGEVFAGLRDLPDTLRGLVAARLDALSTAERAMVEEAAVIGRSGPVYSLLLMAEIGDRPGAEHVFRQLVSKDLFTTEGDRWVFRSDFVRDVAYNTLTKTVRAQHHFYIAEWIAAHAKLDERGESNAMHAARHYHAAARTVRELGPIDGVDEDVVEKAIEWMSAAAAQAENRNSNFSASRFNGEVLELLEPRDPRRITALLGRARARLGLLELDGARGDVQSARRLAQATEDRFSDALALTLAGEIENRENHFDESRHMLRTAIECWNDLGDRLHLAQALRLHGFASMMAGDHRQAEDDYSGALAIFVEVRDSTGEAWCQQNLAWLSFELGHVADADQRLHKAISLFERNCDAGGLGWAYGLLAFVRFHEGDSEAAEAIATKVEAGSAQRGDRLGQAMMHLLLASVHLWSGRCRRAIEEGNRALDVFDATETSFGQIQSLGTLGRAQVAVGNFEEAERLLTRCRLEARGAPGQALVPFAEIVSGASAMQRGDAERALTFLNSDRRSSRDLTTLGSMDRGVTLGLALLQTGDVTGARDALELLETSELDGSRAYLDSARALVELTFGNLEAAELAASSVLKSDKATYLDQRAAHLTLGLVEARRGDEAATRAAFADAIEMIDATDSRTSQAVTRLAHAISLEALGAGDAPVVRKAADAALAAIGLTHTGWHRVFMAAVSDEHSGAPSSA